MINCEFENGNKAHLRHVVACTIIAKDGKIWLAKRANKISEGGKWDLAGGFMDHDETILEAAKREAREESGWEIDDLVLLRINDQPNRPHEDRQNVDFIFTAKAVKQVGDPDDESSEQRWFALDELPPDDEIAFDHDEAIALYKKWLKVKFALPVVG